MHCIISLKKEKARSFFAGEGGRGGKRKNSMGILDKPDEYRKEEAIGGEEGTYQWKKKKKRCWDLWDKQLLIKKKEGGRGGSSGER